MAETQDASTGYNGEVWLHNGTTLVELVQVVSFTLPDDEEERVEKTHLKSPGRRRQYVRGMIEGSEIEVTLNYRPLSDTDALIRAARAAGDERAVKLVIPEDGVPVAKSTFTGRVTGHDRGTVEADGKMEATITIEVVSAETFAAYAE